MGNKFSLRIIRTLLRILAKKEIKIIIIELI